MRIKDNIIRLFRSMPSRHAIVGVGAAIALTVSAVAQVGTASAAEMKKIAIVPKTLINDVFQISIVEGAEEAAKHYGVETARFASSTHVSVVEQINIIESLIARGDFGAILLAAVDSRGLNSVLRKAKLAGIHVIMVDSGVEGSEDYVTIIQTDNVAAAEAGANYAAKLIGEKGRVAMLEGEPGGETAANRTKGFHQGIANYPDIELVTSITGHWTLPGGVVATEAMIAENNDLDLIFAASDMMGVGARQVLDRAANKAEAGGDTVQAEKFRNVKIVGFDGVAEAVKQIWAEKFSGTVAQRPSEMGKQGIDIAVALMKGEKSPADIPRYIDSGMLIVTPENVDSYAAAIGVAK